MASLTLPFPSQKSDQNQFNSPTALRDTTNEFSSIRSDSDKRHRDKYEGHITDQRESSNCIITSLCDPEDGHSENWQNAVELRMMEPSIGTQAEKAFGSLFRPHGILLDSITERNSCSTLSPKPRSFLDSLSLRRLHHRNSAPATLPATRLRPPNDRLDPTQTYPKASQLRASEEDDLDTRLDTCSNTSNDEASSFEHILRGQENKRDSITLWNSPASNAGHFPVRSNRRIRATSPNIEEIFRNLAHQTCQGDPTRDAKRSPRGRVVSPYTVNRVNDSSWKTSTNNVTIQSYQAQCSPKDHRASEAGCGPHARDYKSENQTSVLASTERPKIPHEIRDLSLLTRQQASTGSLLISSEIRDESSSPKCPESPCDAAKSLLTPQPLSISKSRNPFQGINSKPGKNYEGASIFTRSPDSFHDALSHVYSSRGSRDICNQFGIPMDVADYAESIDSRGNIVVEKCIAASPISEYSTFFDDSSNEKNPDLWKSPPATASDCHFNLASSDPFLNSPSRNGLPESESTLFQPIPLRPPSRMRPNLLLFPSPSPSSSNAPPPSHPVHGPRYVRSISSLLRIPSNDAASSMIKNGPKCPHRKPILPVGTFTGQKQSRSFFDSKKRNHERLGADRAYGCKRCALLDVQDAIRPQHFHDKRTRFVQRFKLPRKSMQGDLSFEWPSQSSSPDSDDIKSRKQIISTPVAKIESERQYPRRRSERNERAISPTRRHSSTCRLSTPGQKALEWVVSNLFCRCFGSGDESNAPSDCDDIDQESPSRARIPRLSEARRRSSID